MKIAMIGQKGIPSRAGGVEIHVEEISKRLALNIDVNVYCRKGYCTDGGEYRAASSKLNKLKIKYTPYIRSKHLDAISHTFFSTIKAIADGCDIFHYHALGPSTLAFIPRIFGKKVICTVHGLDWQRGKWGGVASKYLKFGEYATARFSHKTINVSKNLVEYYKDKYNVDTVFIPNGVEKPQIMGTDIIAKKYGLKKDEYILFLARLVPEKGAHYLIDAYKQLKTDKKLVIAGGSSHSSEYEKELHELAKNCENIIFTGFVTGNELRELYSNAYIYVLPSDIEGLPISLLEAMSYGNCCITSDITENTNVIGKYGIPFLKSDITDLKNKIIYCIDNVGKVFDIKKRSSNYVLSTYNWNKIAIETLNIYQNLNH